MKTRREVQGNFGNSTVEPLNLKNGTGENSLILNQQCHAYGKGSIAVGYNTTTGWESYTQYYLWCTATGRDPMTESAFNSYNSYQVAIGTNTVAEGRDSCALGYNLIARRHNQLVIGEYNEPDDNALFIVGNGGGSAATSNAFVVYDDGRAAVRKAPDTATDVVRLTDCELNTYEIQSESDFNDKSFIRSLSERFVIKYVSGNNTYYSPAWIISKEDSSNVMTYYIMYTEFTNILSPSLKVIQPSELIDSRVLICYYRNRINESPLTNLTE